MTEEKKILGLSNIDNDIMDMIQLPILPKDTIVDNSSEEDIEYGPSHTVGDIPEGYVKFPTPTGYMIVPQAEAERVWNIRDKERTRKAAKTKNNILHKNMQKASRKKNRVKK